MSSNNNNGGDGGGSTSRIRRGRKKIPIEKIKNQTNLQVSFSKRRLGLFKKANELSILCGAEIALLVFSPSGKVYSYGHPNLNKVLDKYCGEIGAPSILPTPPTPQKNITEEIMRARQEANMQALVAQLDAMEYEILELTKANQALSLAESRRPSISDLPLSELLLMKHGLEMLRSQVHERLMNDSIMAMQVQSGLLSPYFYFTSNGGVGPSGGVGPNGGVGPIGGVGPGSVGSNGMRLSVTGYNDEGPSVMGHIGVGPSITGLSGEGQIVMGLGPSILVPTSVGQSVMGYNGIGQIVMGHSGEALSIMGPSGVGQIIMGSSDMRQNGVGLSGIRQNGLELSGVGLNGVRLSGVGPINGIGPRIVEINRVGMDGVDPSGMGPSSVAPSDIEPSGIGLSGIGPSDVKPSAV